MAEPPPVTVRVAAASSATTEAPQIWEQEESPKPCVVRGRAVDAKSIAVLSTAGESVFEVDVTAVHMTAHLSPDADKPVEIDVSGALAFRARAPKLPLTVKDDVWAREGVAELFPGVDIQCSAGKRGATTCTAHDDECWAAERTVGPITLRCAVLTLDQPTTVKKRAAVRGDGTQWVPRSSGKVLALRARPRPSAPEVTVRHERGSRCLAFWRIGQQGDWVKLGLRDETLSLVGWTKRSSLSQYRPYSGGYGRGHGGCGWSRGIPKPDTYQGQATVAAGATVTFGSDHVPWATTRATKSFEVRHVRGSQWVNLERVPGLSHCRGRLNSKTAIVPRAAVTFPPSALPR